MSITVITKTVKKHSINHNFLWIYLKVFVGTHLITKIYYYNNLTTLRQYMIRHVLLLNPIHASKQFFILTETLCTQNFLIELWSSNFNICHPPKEIQRHSLSCYINNLGIALSQKLQINTFKDLIKFYFFCQYRFHKQILIKSIMKYMT